jgi:hypothetical protein
MILQKDKNNNFFEAALLQQDCVEITGQELTNYLVQKAKNEKIAEIKRINDEKNIEPTVNQGYLMNENGSLGELVSFEFKTTILFSTLMSKINTRYSTKNAKTGEQIAIQLTPALAQNIVSHLSLRNTSNFQYRDQILAKINDAKTIQEVEAIKWEKK